MTWTTPELTPPLLITTPHQRENFSALDRFNLNRCPTRRVLSGPGFELVTWQVTIRYLYPSTTATTIYSVEAGNSQVDHSECAVKNCWDQWTREGTPARKTGSGATRKTTTKGDQSCGARLQWCQARLMCNVTDWQNVVFSDESRLVLGQIITVYGCGGALGRFSSKVMLFRIQQELLKTSSVIFRLFHGRLAPDLSPVEHMWEELKRQIPSCHSLHDLELAVQDLWAHLPPNNLRCLINSMPDHVAACIAAGGGPTGF
ncbi:uncharacterized protein TNCV_2713501 [Trichonephila clavipes]|nr:uncharacterized protein TNCV_2713501 [Trichonephila clavipes]